ncbi:MAG: nucleotide exchange factor GrpE [Cyclobacteriaceae bacterium]|nr:nucleotide exchange factor GrpE [Cyclobacteriaceae bacterium]
MKKKNTKEEVNDVVENNIVEEVENNDTEVQQEILETEEEEKEETEEIEIEEVSELDKIKDELAEAKDKYLRLYSEFDNYRRRTSKEKLELVKTANEDLISALLPVIDDFERAEKSFDDESDIKAITEGVKLIANKLISSLEQKGLKVMDSEAGIDFDPEIHEAITQIPAPQKKLKGKVVDVIEKGYFLGEKVIRFAKVVTGN